MLVLLNFCLTIPLNFFLNLLAFCNPYNSIPRYKGELLALAKDLADRFLPAFMTNSGFPHPRINLVHGVPENGIKESCTAGIGSLILEFGMLSRLLDEPVYEAHARRAINALWERRNNDTGLLGFAMDVTSGRWLSSVSCLQQP